MKFIKLNSHSIGVLNLFNQKNNTCNSINKFKSRGQKRFSKPFEEEGFVHLTGLDHGNGN